MYSNESYQFFCLSVSLVVLSFTILCWLALIVFLLGRTDHNSVDAHNCEIPDDISHLVYEHT